jgi:carbon storage regulator
MLILSRRPEEELLIGDDIVIKILFIRGGVVRIGIEAPKSVRVDRGEVRKRINAEKQP